MTSDLIYVVEYRLDGIRNVPMVAESSWNPKNNRALYCSKNAWGYCPAEGYSYVDGTGKWIRDPDKNGDRLTLIHNKIVGKLSYIINDKTVFLVAKSEKLKSSSLKLFSNISNDG